MLNSQGLWICVQNFSSVKMRGVTSLKIKTSVSPRIFVPEKFWKQIQNPHVFSFPVIYIFLYLKSPTIPEILIGKVFNITSSTWTYYPKSCDTRPDIFPWIPLEISRPSEACSPQSVRDISCDLLQFDFHDLPLSLTMCYLSHLPDASGLDGLLVSRREFR